MGCSSTKQNRIPTVPLPFRKPATAALLLLFMPVMASGEATDLFVSSETATLRAKPTFDADQQGQLKRGAPLSRLEERNRWVRVSSGEKEGWISELVVSEDEPDEVADSPLGGDQPEMDNPRRRASSTTTAAAARGLSGKAQAEGGAAEGDLEAVERMENFQPEAGEVDTFLEEIR